MDILHTYRYCPRCGKDFEKQATLLVCSHCGLRYYINPKPCTTIIIVNEKRQYLLTKRAREPGKGAWDLAGGFVEDNETFEEGARREALEELGITLPELKYFGSFYDAYDYQGIAYSVLSVAFLCSVPNDTEFHPADDVAACQFFSIDDLPTNNFAFASTKQLFDQLRRSA